MSNFVDFILAAQSDRQLLLDFLKKPTASELKTFFDQKGYSEISLGDCEKLVQAKATTMANVVGDTTIQY
jgi:hypothetical protein